jgi:aromatic ring hydroxylase
VLTGEQYKDSLDDGRATFFEGERVKDLPGHRLLGVSDLENPETGALVRKYMGTRTDVDGEYRTRLFHAIRDLTADSYGGWQAVTNIQAGGGLYAQRIVTRRHYDVESAKQRALVIAGLADGDGLAC